MHRFSRFSLIAVVTLSLLPVGWAERSRAAAPDASEAAPSSPLAEVRQGPEALKPGAVGVGRRIPDVAFQDLEGETHRLSDYADRPALVIALTGIGCPLCQKYAPTLAEIEDAYRARGVAFLLVNPNAAESTERLQQAIRDQGFEAPYVRDLDDRLSLALGARTTTEVFVLDPARTLVYRGAVDDQYGFGYARQTPRETYLRDALDAILAGQQPPRAATSAPGCELFFEDPTARPPAEELTYHNQISRILQRNCLECHREGGLAPFALESYEEVSDYAAMMVNVIQRGVMPPWFAAPETSESLHWVNDRSLAAEDREDLLRWLQSARPAGDPAAAPEPWTYPDNWEIGAPDVVFQIPQPIAVQAKGRMPYKHVEVETGFQTDRWIQAVEIRPTARPVVHHVLVFVQQGEEGIDEESGFLGAYVPGNSHQAYPEGFAKQVPAGAKLIFQLHYTPNGKATEDQTKIGLRFASAEPRYRVRNVGIANHRIEIPPGAENHPESADQAIPQEVRLLAMMPHMHLRGKAFRFQLHRPDGDTQTLLEVPRYDFNWQLEYRLAEPLTVPRGSRLEVTGWFDNSAGNPANPDPTETVGWGPQTEDEMLLGYVEYYDPRDPLAARSQDAREDAALEEPALSPQEAAERTRKFRKADRDGDGSVTPQELPQARLFQRLDADGDGALTLAEVLAR